MKTELYKKFNINHHMYIQINERGWSHLKQTVGDDYIKHCIESRKVEIDNEIWYKLQCHRVFELFPIISSMALFNSNVMFDDKELFAAQEQLPESNIRDILVKYEMRYAKQKIGSKVKNADIPMWMDRLKKHAEETVDEWLEMGF